jgi:hypothetical protein
MDEREVSGFPMKNKTLSSSENACAYSAAVVADAEASVMRAKESVQRAGDTLKRVKKQRESVTRTKSR